MKKQKVPASIAILVACLTVVISCVACSNNDATPTNERTQTNTSTINMITGEVQVTGKVTQIYGNELLLRLAETDESSSTNPEVGGREEMANVEGEVTQRPNMSEMTDEDKASMRENMSAMTEMTDEDKATMRENMTNSDGTMSERGQKNTSEVAPSSYNVQLGMGENLVSAMSIGRATSFILNGGPSADRSNMTDADREAMMSQMGDRTQMGGTTTTTNTADIVLTNDIEEYLIPVGTPVYSMGTALSFSQISKDAYITIHMNRAGDILSVNILG